MKSHEPTGLFCPKCRLPLESLRNDVLSADHCANCGGFWIGPFQLEQLAKRPAFRELICLLDGLQPVQESAAGLDCPNCPQQELYLFRSDSVTIDWCAGCRGIYFDHSELNQVASRRATTPCLEIPTEPDGSMGLDAVAAVLELVIDLGSP